MSLVYAFKSSQTAIDFAIFCRYLAGYGMLKLVDESLIKVTLAKGSSDTSFRDRLGLYNVKFNDNRVDKLKQ